MRSFSGSTDSSKWNWPSSHWNTLNTISRTWLCTARPQLLRRERAHLDEHAALAPPLRERRGPRPRSARRVILPARSSTSPRRSVGRLLVANTTRPPFR